MILFIECLVGCLILTTIVWIGSRNPVSLLHNYPRPIIKRAQELGIAPKGSNPKSWLNLLRKFLAGVFSAAILGLALRYINGVDTYLKGCLYAYLIWFVVDFFDAAVLDCLWFCRDKRFIIPGTEDMVEDYHDYAFHIKKSILGLFLGIPICLVAGLFCIIP